MNQKILLIFLIYYSVLSLFFIFGASTFAGYDYINPVNSSEMQSGEIDQGGLFGTGVSFSRFIGFVTIGVGLPSDTPNWFQVIFSSWQVIVLVLAVGFVIASIWNG